MCVHVPTVDISWPLKGVPKRLDAAQAQWLRWIKHIPSAYYSRITNETVLKRSQQAKWSAQLLQCQLVLYSHVLWLRTVTPFRWPPLMTTSTNQMHQEALKREATH